MEIKLTKEILDNYYKAQKIFVQLGDEILNYAKSKYIGYIDGHRPMSFEKDDLELINNELCVTYWYYDCEGFVDCFYIPIDSITNDTWKEVVDKHFAVKIPKWDKIRSKLYSYNSNW